MNYNSNSTKATIYPDLMTPISLETTPTAPPPSYESVQNARSNVPIDSPISQPQVQYIYPPGNVINTHGRVIESCCHVEPPCIVDQHCHREDRCHARRKRRRCIGAIAIVIILIIIATTTTIVVVNKNECVGYYC
uniref:Uncharacterized protein n=1 Tax=Parastrongyloides trichosuri TaxID=131310 RepID=A0A0N4ZX58_PARTI